MRSVGPLLGPVRALNCRSLRPIASNRFPGRSVRGGHRLVSICRNGTLPPGQGGAETPVYTSLPLPVTPQVCFGRDGGRYGIGGHDRRGEYRTEDAGRGQATALPKGLGPLQGSSEGRGLVLGEGSLQPGRVGKSENRRFLVRALSMCREIFSIKTELATVPTRGDIGEAATDAEGERSLAVVAAVQMLDVNGGVRIGELFATVRRWTLETGPGGRE